MHLRIALVGFLLLAAVDAPLRADDDPQALVDRAIQAMGGADRLNRAKAVEMRMKGTVYSQNEQQALPFTAVAWMELPDRFKHVMVYERGGTKITQTQLYQGDKVAIQIGNNALNIDPELHTALMRGRFADSLTQLTLLKGKELKLTSLGESKVEKQPALGLKVEAPGRPEVQLFFDKTTGLLLKTEHRQLDPRATPRVEVIQEVYFHDYKAFHTTEEDERILKAAKIGTDTVAVLDFLKKQTEQGSDRERILALVKQLGDDAFDKREDATNKLIAIGEPAVPYLKDALKNGDLEVVRRAEHCLKKIGKTGAGGKKEATEPLAAAARLLAARKAEGAAEVLLKALLSTSDDHLAGDLRAALAAVAVIDGKADPALEKAAADKDPVRRNAALEALGKTPLPPGRKILLDGLKRPTKIVVYRAARKFMEWEITDITYVNRIDDATFVIK
jgi:hypothetical protein